MDKNEFLGRLRAALVSLPWEECASAVKYYEEYFADAGEDREGEILTELGSPEAVAAVILSDYSSAPARLSDVQAADAGHREVHASAVEAEAVAAEPWYRRTPLWVLILLGLLASPILLPLLGGLIALIFGLFVALLGMAVALVALVCSVGVTGISFTVGGVVALVVAIGRLMFSPAAGVLLLGEGLVLLALGILTLLGTIWLFSKAVPSVIRGFTSLLRGIFNRGGDRR